MIGHAVPADVAGIAAIWNPIIRDTAITFTAVEKTGAALTDLIAARPVLVAATDAIAGFTTYGPFRGGDGYRHTAELTIHVAERARGQGVGRALLTKLVAHAKGQGIHTLWAGCSAENPAGATFHERMGFTRTAVLPQVGRKFDRWIDLILLHRVL